MTPEAIWNGILAAFFRKDIGAVERLSDYLKTALGDDVDAFTNFMSTVPGGKEMLARGLR